MENRVNRAESTPEDPVDPVKNNLQESHRALLFRRVSSGLLWGQLGRVLEIGLGLVFSVVVVRSLGPRDYGVYSVIWSIIGISALLASLGFGETLLRYIPELQLKNESAAAILARRLLSERTLASLVIAVLVWFGAGPISDWTRTPELLPLIGLVALLIIAQGIWDLFSSFFNALLRVRENTIVRFTGLAIGLGVALALFLMIGISIWVPMTAILVSYLVASVLYWLKFTRAHWLPDQQIELAPIRRFGLYAWLTNLATFGLANQVDILLIAALLTDKNQAGYYNASVLLLPRLYILLSGWNTILVPAAAEARAREPEAGLSRSFNAFMKVNLVVLLPVFIFVAAWSQPLITSLFQEAFIPAAPLLTMFTLFTIASTLVGANVCYPLLYVADRQRFLLGLRIVAGVLNVVLNLVLIPRLGAAGAVIATGVSNLVAHITELVVLKLTVEGPYPVDVAAKLLLASFVAILPRILLPDSGWVSLVAGGVLFGAIFSALFYLLRPFSQADYITISNAVPRLGSVLRWLSALRG